MGMRSPSTVQEHFAPFTAPRPPAAPHRRPLLLASLSIAGGGAQGGSGGADMGGPGRPKRRGAPTAWTGRLACRAKCRDHLRVVTSGNLATPRIQARLTQACNASRPSAGGVHDTAERLPSCLHSVPPPYPKPPYLRPTLDMTRGDPALSPPEVLVQATRCCTTPRAGARGRREKCFKLPSRSYVSQVW
jgi:hypothetical protein